MDNNQLLLQPIKNSQCTVVYTANGSIVAKYWLMSYVKDSRYPYFIQFAISEETYLAEDILQVHYCLKTIWMLFNVNTII